MRIVLFLFLIGFITSCDPPYIEDNPYLPDKDSLATEVTNKTLAQLKRDTELYPCGIGSGMMDQIRMLALSFNYFKEVDIAKARELLMTVGVLFLKTINGNEKIRPFLQNYPFKPENIQIRIFLHKPNGLKPEPDKLTVASLISGKLKYKITSSETEHLITVYEETYPEAAAKLGVDVNL
jgi:hypothetical protein